MGNLISIQTIDIWCCIFPNPGPWIPLQPFKNSQVNSLPFWCFWSIFYSTAHFFHDLSICLSPSVASYMATTPHYAMRCDVSTGLNAQICSWLKPLTMSKQNTTKQNSAIKILTLCPLLLFQQAVSCAYNPSTSLVIHQGNTLLLLDSWKIQGINSVICMPMHVCYEWQAFRLSCTFTSFLNLRVVGGRCPLRPEDLLLQGCKKKKRKIVKNFNKITRFTGWWNLSINRLILNYFLMYARTIWCTVNPFEQQKLKTR